MELVNVSNETLASLRTFVVQAPANFVGFCVGMVSFVCNVLMIRTFVRSKDFKSKSQKLVLCLCVSDALASLSLGLTCLKRYLNASLPYFDNVSRLVCLVESFPLITFLHISIVLMLEMSMDRFLLLALPVYYNKLPTNKYVHIANVVAWIYGLSIGGYSLYLNGENPRRILPFCTTVASMSPQFASVSNFEADLITICTVLFYAMTLILLWRRIKSIKHLSETQKREQSEMLELRVYRTILAVLTIYILCIGVKRIVATVRPYLSIETAVRLNPYVDLVSIINEFSPFVIYLLFSRKFKTAFFAMFRKPSETVTSVVSLNMAQKSVSRATINSKK